MILILTENELGCIKDSAILRADIACVKQPEGFNVFKNRTTGICKIYDSLEFLYLVDEYIRLKGDK